MKIIQLKSIDSTQQYMISNIKNGNIRPPTCVFTTKQYAGIGSRGDEWVEADEGFYFSFCISKTFLPYDLKPQSTSIFFGFLFKECLNTIGSKVWLKWPNDIYLSKNKVGGVLCNILNDIVVCGIGLNILSSKFGCLENNIKINNKSLLNNLFNSIADNTWGDVYSKYILEFDKNYPFSFRSSDRKIQFKGAKLLSDGSILVDNETFYSNR